MESNLLSLIKIILFISALSAKQSEVSSEQVMHIATNGIGPRYVATAAFNYKTDSTRVRVLSGNVGDPDITVTGYVSSLALSGDGMTVAIGMADQVRIIRQPFGPNFFRIDPLDTVINDIDPLDMVLNHGHVAAVRTRAGEIRIFEAIPCGRQRTYFVLERTRNVNMHGFGAMSLSSDGSTFAIAKDDGSGVRVFKYHYNEPSHLEYCTKDDQSDAGAGVWQEWEIPEQHVMMVSLQAAYSPAWVAVGAPDQYGAEYVAVYGLNDGTNPPKYLYQIDDIKHLRWIELSIDGTTLMVCHGDFEYVDVYRRVKGKVILEKSYDMLQGEKVLGPRASWQMDVGNVAAVIGFLDDYGTILY
eukprot:261933_1